MDSMDNNWFKSVIKGSIIGAVALVCILYIFLKDLI